MQRRKMSNKASKKYFTKNAVKSHRKNQQTTKRGGGRL